MSVDTAALGIEQLSVGERLELIEFIWDTLPQEVSSDELSPDHLSEIQKRRAAAESQPGVGKPWREILDRLGTKS